MKDCRPLLFLILALLLVGCSANPNPVFLGTLWVQTAAEYEAMAVQAFSLANDQLEEALADPAWTAALEQEGSDFGNLPPAVIVDVDETVLDNSPFEADLALKDLEYDEDLWEDWFERGSAKALPGAVDFLNAAHDRGVTVFYVTNRSAEGEAATRKNLQDEGFPIDESKIPDVVLTKGENGWESDKITRREAVAKTHRVLLLLGDDLNDFVSGARARMPDPRKELSDQHAKRWGRSWILLPNPLYGSWEASLYGRDYSLTKEQKREQMERYLRPPT